VAKKNTFGRGYPRHYKEGEYKFALEMLSSAEQHKESTPDLKAEIVYLRATCYEGLERYDEAIGAFRYLVDKLPNTSYAYQAKEKLRRLEKRN